MRRQYVGRIIQVSEAVLFVTLDTSSFPTRNEIYGKTIEKFMPIWVRARSHLGTRYMERPWEQASDKKVIKTLNTEVRIEKFGKISM